MSFFSNRAFVGCCIAYTFMGYNFSTILITGSLYLQNALDYSPLHTGFIFLTMTVVFGALSVYGGKLADKVDPRIPIAIGRLATALALCIFSFFTQHTQLWQVITALVIAGVGIGLAFPSLNTAMLSSVKQDELNTASGAFTMFVCLGNSAGLIFSTLIIVTVGKTKLLQLLTQQHPGLTADQQHMLTHVISSTHYGSDQLQNFSLDLIPSLLDNIRTAFCHAVSITMLISMVLAIVAVIISLVMIKLPARSKAVTAQGDEET